MSKGTLWFRMYDLAPSCLEEKQRQVLHEKGGKDKTRILSDDDGATIDQEFIPLIDG